MELRQLHTFTEVARTGSFTRAAAALDYAQSSVSSQMQALEEELGVSLFDRLGRRTVVTEAGERLIHYANKILGLAEEAKVAVPGLNEPTGTVTISAPESLCTYRLPAVLEHFSREFPHVDLIFVPSPTSTDWERLITEGHVDAALFMAAADYRSPNISMEPLVYEPVLAVAHPDHRLVGHPYVPMSEFRDETLLLTEAGCRYRTVFTRNLRAAGVVPANTIEFHSVEAIKQCTMAGMGVAVLPRMSVASEMAAGRLRPLALPFDIELITNVGWHPDRWLSPALREFLDATRTLLRAEGMAEKIEAEMGIVPLAA